MVVVGVVALATAPAAAAEPEFLKPLGWYPEEAGLRSQVPAGVEFHDVASVDPDSGRVVVAVGTNTAPVIYRRTDAGWQPAPVEAPLPAAGKLDHVVLSGSGATGWAIGTTGDPPQPLVLTLADGVWRDRTAVAALPATPTAVALNGGGAIVGDTNGSLHWLAADGTKTRSESPAGAGAINGIALSPAIAVAGYESLAGEPADKSVRIYNLGDPPLLDANEDARTAGVNMTGLAANASNHAVALDSTNATWRLTISFGQNEWVQGDPVPGASALDAVASVKGGPSPYDGTGWATEFLAGTTAQGALWHRTRWTKDPAGWKPDELPAGTPALTGVAATKWNAAWAVGAGGTILRYWRPPDPEAEAAWLAAQQQQQQTQQQPQTGTTGGTQEPTQEPQMTTVTLGEWTPEDSASLDPGEERVLTNGVVVTDGDSTVPKPKRLVKNVKAIFRRDLSGRRKLIVKFRLTRRASVRVSAKRNRRVIARSARRTMRRGRHKVVLPIRGKTPPTSLKIVARPKSKAT